MKRPTPPEPSEILEELAGEVLAPMDRGAVTSFSDALDGMIDFHAFLLRAHTIVNEQGQTDSYRGWLNGLVSMFDNLTEREVVPGRGFSPTLSGQFQEFFKLLFGHADMPVLHGRSIHLVIPYY
jgi:hypothetical protein